MSPFCNLVHQFASSFLPPFFPPLPPPPLPVPLGCRAAACFASFVSPAEPLVPLGFFPLGKYFSNPLGGCEKSLLQAAMTLAKTVLLSVVTPVGTLSRSCARQGRRGSRPLPHSSCCSSTPRSRRRRPGPARPRSAFVPAPPPPPPPLSPPWGCRAAERRRAGRGACGCAARRPRPRHDLGQRQRCLHRRRRRPAQW